MRIGGGGSRYLVKKAARALCGAVGPVFVGTNARRSLRVLTYHRFGEIPNDVFCLPTNVFESQIRWIAEQKIAVSLNAVCDFLAGGPPLPDRAILVTIDDGHTSTWTEARPILQAYDVPAVAFVTSGLVGKNDLGGQLSEPYLSWDKVAKLEEAGIAIGSHAHNHRSVGLLSEDDAWEEVDRSRRMLRERTGAPVRSFAYPFGTRVDSTPEAARLVAQAGYDCAFTSQHGAITRDLDPFRLPRIKIEAGDPSWHFERACRGAMDPWQIVDDLMWRLQQDRSDTLALERGGATASSRLSRKDVD